MLHSLLFLCVQNDYVIKKKKNSMSNRITNLKTAHTYIIPLTALSFEVRVLVLIIKFDQISIHIACNAHFALLAQKSRLFTLHAPDCNDMISAHVISLQNVAHYMHSNLCLENRI